MTFHNFTLTAYWCVARIQTDGIDGAVMLVLFGKSDSVISTLRVQGRMGSKSYDLMLLAKHQPKLQ